VISDGTQDAPITMRPYSGEDVLIDGDNMPHTPAPIGGDIPRPERGALHVQGDWWRFEDLEIANGPYGIFALDSNNNVYEGLVTRDNYESGLHIQGESGGNQILNLDSYGNRDPRKNGRSSDGLAIKEGSGEGNVVVGARLWHNSDDGFDAWEFESAIVIEDSVAWGNGFNRWDLPDYEGDGNGFKMGGGNPAVLADHVIRNSIAFDNIAHGFTDNGNPGSLELERNTAYGNGKSGFSMANSTSTLNGNLAVGNESPDSPGSSSGSGNSWDIDEDWTDGSLADTDPSTITGPRDSDGSVPAAPDFLRPIGHEALGARF
jgi:parallel beta-helix repeat protein